MGRMQQGLGARTSESPEPEGSEPQDSVQEVKRLWAEDDWQDTPMIKDQMLQSMDDTSVPGGLWKMMEPQCRAFNLSKEDELKAYNEVLAGTVPSGAPSVIIFQQREEFFEGVFYGLLRWAKVKYRKVVREKK